MQWYNGNCQLMVSDVKIEKKNYINIISKFDKPFYAVGTFDFVLLT